MHHRPRYQLVIRGGNVLRNQQSAKCTSTSWVSAEGRAHERGPSNAPLESPKDSRPGLLAVLCSRTRFARVLAHTQKNSLAVAEPPQGRCGLTTAFSPNGRGKDLFGGVGGRRCSRTSARRPARRGPRSGDTGKLRGDGRVRILCTSTSRAGRFLSTQLPALQRL